MYIQVLEAFGTSNRHDQKINSPCLIVVKKPRVHDKEKMWKSGNKKFQFTHKNTNLSE